MFSATGAVGAVFMGAVADRLNLWRLLRGGLALIMVGGISGSLATVAPELMVSRFVEGVGFLAVVIAGPSIIGRTTDTDMRRIALGLWPAYMPVGVSLMMLSAPLALKVGGWQFLWIIGAVLAIIAIGLTWSCDRSATEEPTVARLSPWKNICLAASSLGPWLISACFVLFGIQLYAVITWMPTFIIDERAFSATAAAMLTAGVIVSNGLANPVGSWLLYRGADPWKMILFAAVAMGGLAFGMFATWVPDIARYVCSILLSAAGGLAASAAFAAAPLLAPSVSQLGIVNGFLVQASNLAQFIGPVAAAATVATFRQWEDVVWLFAGADLLLIVLSLLGLWQQPMRITPGSRSIHPR